MEYPIASLAGLLDFFAGCFRAEVFGTFKTMVAAWAVCPGPRTISEVWQATGQAARRHHDTAHALWSSAKWDWDELGKILVLIIVARLLNSTAAEEIASRLGPHLNPISCHAR